ncbi:hypothetical protein TL16_g09856 [Triparma laevis f. inornata]|uniref:Uncharacterized protein n=1 Tax=Triparma laevis f. inornata TaxID=1714386 RepID=A0A9W7BA58_9STRA|nr:hypothetical protein TL16_g09856 [Triparma laevis f. inornata]
MLNSLPPKVSTIAMGKRSRSSSSDDSSSSSSGSSNGSVDSEERDRESNRKIVLDRKRQFQVVDGEGGGGDNPSDGSDDSDGESVKKKSKKEKKEKKEKKKKKKKEKKEKKRKHKKEKKEKKEKKSKKDKSSSSSSSAPPKNTFGSRGIVKNNEYNKYQRSFEAWMGEVKKIPSFTGAKWELQEYFKEFAEDFNTCSFPHEKFYNYDKWEMEDYQRKQSDVTGGSGMVSDEARHREEMAKKEAAKRNKEMQETIAR